MKPNIFVDSKAGSSMNGWSNQLFQLDPEIKVHTSLAMALLVCSFLKILEQDYKKKERFFDKYMYMSLQGPTETEGCKPPLHL
jgi:hypothetical protein